MICCNALKTRCATLGIAEKVVFRFLLSCAAQIRRAVFDDPLAFQRSKSDRGRAQFLIAPKSLEKECIQGIQSVVCFLRMGLLVSLDISGCRSEA